MAETKHAFVSPFLPFEDPALDIDPGLNERPAVADLVNIYIIACNELMHGGRQLFTMWGGDIASTSNVTNAFRQVWNHRLVSGNRPRASALILPDNGAYVDGQGVRASLAGTATDTHVLLNLEGGTARSEPDGLMPMDLLGGLRDNSADAREEVIFGSLTANGPGLASLLFYEAAHDLVDPASTFGFTDAEHVGTGLDIIGNAADARMKLDRLRDMFLHLWHRRRPQLGWSATNPGTNYIELDDSPYELRHFFDQAYGDGGTAISATTPGLTLPLKAAGAGRRTQIRVAVFVHAAMSEAAKTVTDATNATPIVVTTSAAHGFLDGDTVFISGVSGNTAANGTWTVANKTATTFELDGSAGNGAYGGGGQVDGVGAVGVANKDASGTMAASPTIVSGLGVIGNSFTWAPSLGATLAYFDGYTGGTYDRVVLCGRSLTTGYKLRIGGFSLFPYHAT